MTKLIAFLLLLSTPASAAICADGATCEFNVTFTDGEGKRCQVEFRRTAPYLSVDAKRDQCHDVDIEGIN